MSLLDAAACPSSAGFETRSVQQTIIIIIIVIISFNVAEIIKLEWFSCLLPLQ